MGYVLFMKQVIGFFVLFNNGFYSALVVLPSYYVNLIMMNENKNKKNKKKLLCVNRFYTFLKADIGFTHGKFQEHDSFANSFFLVLFPIIFFFLLLLLSS